MADGRYLGRGLLVQALMDQLGTSRRMATKAVNAVFTAMGDAIKEGKRVKIDGLGTLRVVQRNRPARRIGHHPTKGMSIYNYREKSIELRNVKLKLEVY